MTRVLGPKEISHFKSYQINFLNRRSIELGHIFVLLYAELVFVYLFGSLDRQSQECMNQLIQISEGILRYNASQLTSENISVHELFNEFSL